jgi:thioredoxin
MKKKIFSFGTMIKLFFLTSISAANPLAGCTSQPHQDKTIEVTKEVSKDKEVPKAAVLNLSEAEFKKMVYDYDKNQSWKYEGNKPAIIDFYADWCAPCRQLSPVVEEIAKEYSGKIVVYKVDTEKEQKLAQKIGISALPTLLFIPVTGKPQVTMGVLPKESLVKAVNEVLQVK